MKLRDCSITTDIIVGFPGESDDDFEVDIKALDQIRFDQIFSFKFSPRPGTTAEHMADQIPEEVKKRRFAKIHVNPGQQLPKIIIDYLKDRW